jgi:hypothetical protein
VLVDDARDIAMLCEALERGVLGVGDGGSILRAVPAVPQEVIPHSHESVLDQPPGCGGTRAKPVGKSGSVLEGVIGHLTRPMGGGDVRKRSAQVDSSWDDVSADMSQCIVGLWGRACVDP